MGRSALAFRTRVDTAGLQQIRGAKRPCSIISAHWLSVKKATWRLHGRCIVAPKACAAALIAPPLGTGVSTAFALVAGVQRGQRFSGKRHVQEKWKRSGSHTRPMVTILAQRIPQRDANLALPSVSVRLQHRELISADAVRKPSVDHAEEALTRQGAG